MVLGALAAISQTNIKRLMAYSSIGHIGFALVGLAAGTQEGVKGVLLDGARAGTPAEAAGIEKGDVVVEFAGKRVENIYDYVNVLNGLKVGKPVDMVVVRDGRRLTLTVVPAARE